MISFMKFGKLGRLGNQLFQYAFLRSTAQRLGVPFYCPSWIGDDVFDLHDEDERLSSVGEIHNYYSEPEGYTGFNQNALRIQDGTDIHGYFQTEKYFCDNVRTWYTFKDSALTSVKNRFKMIDFENSVGVSVRLGDFVTAYGHMYYVPLRRFYLKSLELTPRSESVIVFSDDIAGASSLLGDLGTKTHFIENYEPYEGLYLQSLCRDFICSPSTYAWWGSWLNSYSDSVIVAPAEGAFRPGAKVRNREYWPERYKKIPALRPGLDNLTAYRLKNLTKRGIAKIKAIL